MIVDPLYNSNYSDFCYEQPYMPGLTNYADTPVVPTAGFVGAAYNNPDCSYPDTTPAIKEVDGDQVGPWVSAAGTGHTLTITALGDVQVNNSAYSGPAASAVPFNQKTIKRHYGFGTQCTTAIPGSTTCNTVSGVTIGGITATIGSWMDTAITVTVPTGVANCAIQQQAQYASGATSAQCGQLIITAGNGKQSIDTVTVTIGGKMPTHVNANQTIQSAIDAAAPGDLLMIDPTCTTAGTTTAATCDAGSLHAATPTQTSSVGAHTELLIMWKPVRLQGVGAASSIINASAFPAGQLLDPWRRHINCLFGLSISGVPTVGNGTGAPSVPYDPNNQYACPDTGWNYFTTPGALNVPQVDRLPLEAIVGWSAIVNGNLAEQLQEPSLMGAYEGAGITVLAKGVWTSPGENIWTDTTEGGAFPSDALLLQDVPAGIDDEGGPLGPQYDYCTSPATTTELTPNPYPSNFECNPSSIDGLTVANSSQGGGGIFVHGWAHNLQIANNRVYNNAGTLSGGITVGQGEFPIAITIVTQEGAAVGGPTGQFDADNPPSCQNSSVIGTHLPYCLDLHVNVHNNSITSNSSLGDELFSGTLAGAGGASFCTGSDYYKFQFNWVCGNLSSSEGGGVAHVGFIYNGDIEHNTIVFNQSTNPTIPTNGGGIMVMGTPDTDPVCGNQIDQDCPPGLSDGTGPGLVINANLIQGNMAESGSGGGIRLQQVNGTDISTFPTGCVSASGGSFGRCPIIGGTHNYSFWNSASVTNNIIVNNLAGWDGAGISLQDSLNVSIINNTVASNDSLASSGVLTQSIGTPQASAPAGSCVQLGPTGPTTASCPQAAGVSSTPNSSILTTTFTGLTITCPPGHTTCTGFSNPLLQNNLIWQNRSFQIGITGPGTGYVTQQNLVGLFDAFTGASAPVQSASGGCTTGVSYWDIGVRGDTAPNNHSSGFTLSPTYSVLTSTTGYDASNLAANPSITSQYCNGSRVPPECSVADGCGGPSGYGVPPGIVDASTPNPIFSLTPSATVDEGNNWINVSWGPLALSNDSVTGGTTGNYGGGPLFANYALQATSPAIDYVPVAQTHPSTDFFGNARPDPANLSKFDVGAIEYQGAGTGEVYVSPTTLLFTQVFGTPAGLAQTLTVTNGTTAGITGLTVAVATTSPTTTARFSRAGGTCGTTLGAGLTCTITISFSPPTTATNVTYMGTVTITSSATVAGSPVALTGEGIVPVPAASVSPSSLTFGNQNDGSTSAAQTLTVTNTGNVALAGGTFTFGGGAPQPFSRPGGAAGGTCTATLAVGATCTYNVVFAPPAATTSTAYSRTLAVAYTGVTVTGSPVILMGTGIPVGTLSFTSATNGTLSTVLGLRRLTFTIPTPRAPVTSVVTITNTGAGTLQITAETLALNIGARYSITGTTCSFTTPLAPAGACTVSIRYATPATRPIIADMGLATLANNGSGTVLGVTGLVLVAQ
jgi:hypothetical protein